MGQDGKMGSRRYAVSGSTYGTNIHPTQRTDEMIVAKMFTNPLAFIGAITSCFESVRSSSKTV